MQNRFSSELSMRCQAEFENAHQDVGDNFIRLKARICEVTDAIRSQVITHSTGLGRKVKLQFCNITNSTCSQNQKQKQILVRETYEITQNTFFLELETINTNSFLLLSNQRPSYIKYLPRASLPFLLA